MFYLSRKLLIVTIVLFITVKTNCSDELDDFDFDFLESNPSVDDYYYNDEVLAHGFVKPYDNVDKKENSFDIKQKKIKAILLKAWSNRSMMPKFAEILPILRYFSRQQKLALSALISAQVSADKENELNLQQVIKMFGNKPELILPLSLDIANLVKKSSETQQRERENEKISKLQILRRSYNYEMPSTSYIHEAYDRKMKQRKIRDLSSQYPLFERPPPLVHYHPKSKQEISNIDHTTYHERKLNMTAFNGKDDQLAMPSQKYEQILKRDGTVPTNRELQNNFNKINNNKNYLQQNLTIEEIEKLAFSQLNGTEVDEDYANVFVEDNENEQYIPNKTEINNDLPTAEKLIRIRVRSKYTKDPPRQKKPPITLTKRVTPNMNEMGNCEKFANLCIITPEYPTNEIMGSIRRHHHVMTALLAEYIDKVGENGMEIGTTVVVKRRTGEEVEHSASGMCPSIVRYARPQKARSATGQWKFIVNTGHHTQTLRLEKCSSPQNSCTYLTDNFRSKCVQVFNYHRLLSWDKIRGLHVDIFKVPTCCSCRIEGYREQFPPLYNKLKSPNTLVPPNIIDDFNLPSYSSLPSNPKNTKLLTSSFIEQYNNDAGFNESSDEDSDEIQIPNYYSPHSEHKHNNYNVVGQKTAESVTLNRYKKPMSIINTDNSPFVASTPSLSSYVTTPSKEIKNKLQHATQSIIQPTKNKRKRGPNRRKQSNADDSLSFMKIEEFPITTKRPKRIINRSGTGTTSSTAKAISNIFSTIPASNTFQNDYTTAHRINNEEFDSPKTHGYDYNKRINYNYHPIIDFFDEEQEEDNVNDRNDEAFGLVQLDQNQWRPIVYE